ncbi:MAG: PilZ domain-containing protein [Pseudomonadota bacterium]|nr:PilZ domain-containing protein [Pseudomonadota bacterium]
MTAALEVSGRVIDVTLRNLSSDGAQVEGGQLPVEGTKLSFCKGELALPATVIWTKGKQAGIHFDEKLDPATVLNHISAPRPRMAGDFRRPGLATPRLTERERALAKNWIAAGPSPTVGD